MKRKLTVITDEHGRVVATQVGHGDIRDPKSGILVGIVAGPRQHAHKIEYDVPPINSRTDIESFHTSLAEHLSRTGGKKT